mgnify:CR=1 FL=1
MLNMFKNYDDEYEEILTFLTDVWRFKPEYSKLFLDRYKKKIGKKLTKEKSRLEDDDDDWIVQDYIVNALILQAHEAFCIEIRAGYIRNPKIEKVIFAILWNKSDLLPDHFKEPFKELQEKKHPNIYEEVFS